MSIYLLLVMPTICLFCDHPCDIYCHTQCLPLYIRLLDARRTLLEVENEILTLEYIQFLMKEN